MTDAAGRAALELSGPFEIPDNGAPVVGLRVLTGNDGDEEQLAEERFPIPATAFFEQLRDRSAVEGDFARFAGVFPEARLPDDLASRRRQLVADAERARAEDAARQESKRRESEARAAEDLRARKTAAAKAWAALRPRTLVSVKAFIEEHGEENVPDAALALREKLVEQAEASLLVLVGRLLADGDAQLAFTTIQEARAAGVPTEKARGLVVASLTRALALLVGPPIARRGGPTNGAEFHALRTLFGYRAGGAQDLFEALVRAEKGDAVDGGLDAFLAQPNLGEGGRRLWLLGSLRKLGVPAAPTMVDQLLAVTAKD